MSTASLVRIKTPPFCYFGSSSRPLSTYKVSSPPAPTAFRPNLASCAFNRHSGRAFLPVINPAGTCFGGVETPEQVNNSNTSRIGSLSPQIQISHANSSLLFSPNFQQRSLAPHPKNAVTHHNSSLAYRVIQNSRSAAQLLVQNRLPNIAA